MSGIRLENITADLAYNMKDTSLHIAKIPTFNNSCLQVAKMSKNAYFLYIGKSTNTIICNIIIQLRV